MKIKFLERCIDKYNGQAYEKNNVYDFEDQKRAKEIVEKGYAVVVLDAKQEEKPKNKEAKD